MAEPQGQDFLGIAHAWLEAEPDEDIRTELNDLLTRNPADVEELFAGALTFGTAGLRAPIGPGPLRMNRLVVRQAAAGLVDHLLEQDPEAADRGILVGFDARHKSREFAEDTARVAAARGMRVRLFEAPVPTPVLAWNVTRHNVAGAVMVTASHNPAGDNGYKVYRANGAQIVSPIDEMIANKIRAVDPLSVALASVDSPLVTRLDHGAVEAYLAWVPSVRLRPEVAGVPLAYTALHGVGGDVAVRALENSGFLKPSIVDVQHRPDPNFSTVAFPNPEEQGAMDLVIDLARRSGASMALANDPDADRLGVAIPTESGEWRRLSGDEIGWLMADHILANTRGADRLVLTTLVSSSLLGKMALAHGVEFEETFTGFKWMASAVERHPRCRLVFAYEQALGFLVTSEPLDKDGITAAVVMAEIAGLAAQNGETIEDRLDAIAERFGRHMTAESSIRVHPSVGSTMVEELRKFPPETIEGRRVIDVVSYPEASLVRLLIEGSGQDPVRIQVRPSGTEPKVKVYAEAVGEDPRPLLDGVIRLLR
ncbi:MAG: phospho-sugar mutase [Actinomycetota bacterium]